MEKSLENKIYSYPFSRYQIGEKYFVPCCDAWLKDEYFELESGEDPWNGEAAQKLRESQLDGSFRYCRTDVCGGNFLTAENPYANHSFETPISHKVLRSIRKKKSKLFSGPTALTFNTDPRCNLSCPSCRPEPIYKVDFKTRLKMMKVYAHLKKYRKSLQVLKLSGNGEVFFSPWLKKVLKSIDPKKFPQMKSIFILSNGLLFDQKMYNSLMPGAQFIKQVSISIDAGDRETYAEVRGGNWDKLMKNLAWMSDMREAGHFDFLEISFVVRLENYKSLLNFAKLADIFSIDRFKLLPLLPWAQNKINYNEQAIHEMFHPENRELVEIYKQIKDHPKINCQFELDDSFHFSV